MQGVAVAPRSIKASVPVLVSMDLDCWIIDVVWFPAGEVGCRCSLCSEYTAMTPYALIRYKPDQSIDGKSMSERQLRACSRCGERYGPNPFPKPPPF